MSAAAMICHYGVHRDSLRHGAYLPWVLQYMECSDEEGEIDQVSPCDDWDV